MKIVIILLVCCSGILLRLTIKAQLQLNSVGLTKPFYLALGYQGRKGGYVWYKGQNAPMV